MHYYLIISFLETSQAFNREVHGYQSSMEEASIQDHLMTQHWTLSSAGYFASSSPPSLCSSSPSPWPWSFSNAMITSRLETHRSLKNIDKLKIKTLFYDNNVILFLRFRSSFAHHPLLITLQPKLIALSCQPINKLAKLIQKNCRAKLNWNKDNDRPSSYSKAENAMNWKLNRQF